MLSPDGDAHAVWLALPGSGDTLFRPGRDARWIGVDRPGWILSQASFPLADAWERVPKQARFTPVGSWSFAPVWRDLAWVRDGRSWTNEVTERRGPMDKRIPPPTPGTAPSNAPESVRWKITPPLLRPGGLSRIKDLGTVIWDGAVSNGPHGLLAHGRLRPDPNFRSSLGRRPLPVSVQVEWRRSQGRDSVVVPATPRVRFDSASVLPLWKGASVTTTGADWSVVVQGRSLSLVVDSSWQPESESHEDPGMATRKHHGTAPLLWARGSDVRLLRGLGPLPDAAAIFDSGFAEAVVGKEGVTFRVAEVDPDTSPLPRIGFDAWREDVRPRARDSLFEWIAGNAGSDRLVSGGHPFLAAAVDAWNEHRPLRLSPDAVWMVMLEALATRVEKNPEICRSDMVLHRSGKIGLDAELTFSHLGHLDQDTTWKRIVNILLTHLDSHVVSGRGSALAPFFSTTTPTRALAMRGRILQMHSHYFDYRALAACGIPRITLEGVPEDWKRLRQQVRSLGACGLERWVEQVDPVLAEFVRASEGHPSRAFWNTFVRYNPPVPICGSSPYVDGWITALMPVDNGGDIRPFLEPLNFDAAPDPIGDATIRLRGLDGTWSPYKLRSGFSGVAQAPDGSLFPELGWSVWKAVCLGCADATTLGSED